MPSAEIQPGEYVVPIRIITDSKRLWNLLRTLNGDEDA